MNIKIAPSLLAADFSDLAREVKKVESGGCDLIHFDIMDGHFVPNITMGPLVVAALRDKTDIPFDVHLMIENPGKYIDPFIKAGANIITVHVETCRGFTYIIDHIKRQGIRAGLALNPGTSLTEIESYLDRVDFYLLMMVNPGFGGQEFMPDVLPKISSLRQLCLNRGLEVDIEVDGGITRETAPRVVKEGANVLVAGSAIFNSPDPSAEVTKIRQAAEKQEGKL
ncbi:MAG: ribulose-phosphate 3-epimerase [bacterium]|nr:ribulose-phosphate 3-epimerase [bacterium]